MVGDLLSKPITGSKFLRFRKKIMNYKPDINECHHTKKVNPKLDEDDSKNKSVSLVSVGKKRIIKSGYW